MNITIKALHINITGALKEYAEKKVEKILKFFDNIQDVVIELDIRDSADEDERQFAAGILHASQTAIRAEEASRDMYASIDAVCDKLALQLKKHKEKLRDHNRKEAMKGLSDDDAVTPKSKRDLIHEADSMYVPKPMDIDEAVDLLIEKKTPLLMFRNIRSEEINVVYVISKGKFGLIEP
jgi:putative sigma-54 modulation protein